MRARLSFAALFISMAALIAMLASQAAVPMPVAVAKDEKKVISDDRDDLTTKLYMRISIDKYEGVPLKEIFDLLRDKYEVTILVDAKSLQGAAMAGGCNADEILGAPINVPAMKNVRLATVLKHIVDQIDGVFLLYPDHIKIVGASRAYTLTNPVVSDYRPEADDPALESFNDVVRSIPLVHANFKEVALQDALREVELRTNRSIVLASQVGDKAKAVVTARFTNVPVDTAVATLAESAGLSMARKGNVLLVTIAGRAKEFAPPPAANLNPFGFGAPDPQVEELKTKVAELEKTIAELKKK